MLAPAAGLPLLPQLPMLITSSSPSSSEALLAWRAGIDDEREIACLRPSVALSSS